ncbi:Protein MOTHER of FT and TF 1 [Rhynchospora pubera]|uniref:Protein MOTHER of FT and TF 1 n=1 Tax=Rhynchospora pubera TaxID=906938 RepID=A0AAV8FPS6_9POAL|nr:Protein MOTHER of FT and TF 1 [Rhynchospora pubera]KAJ4816642.1 Protein MOTHER of FT and TF 1 [Rhynchospora pubera]
MARVINALIIGNVIWDVVDTFVPTVNMLVNYGGKEIITGCDLKPSILNDPPAIHISGGRCNDLYTLVMIDPDSPSPCDFNMREFLHWVVINIPGGSDGVSRGYEVVPYLAPNPQVGVHRFVLVLFQQHSLLRGICEMNTRARFCTRDFSRDHNLGPPVAAAFFNCRRERQGRNMNPGTSHESIS